MGIFDGTVKKFASRLANTFDYTAKLRHSGVKDLDPKLTDYEWRKLKLMIIGDMFSDLASTIRLMVAQDEVKSEIEPADAKTD